MSNDLVVKSDDPNALAKLAEMTQASLQVHADGVLEAVAKSADYLCRLALCGSASTLFKKNKIPKGHYAYITSKDDFIDLGLSVDVMPIGWRPKAIDMSNDMPVSFYDVASQGFKDTCEKSKVSDSNCTYGPEYLVWIPQIKKFATLHYSSKTARKDYKEIHNLLNKGVTLSHKIVENDKHIWESMVATTCSTPFDLPDLTVAQDTLTKFMDEMKKKAPEKAGAPASSERPR